LFAITTACTPSSLEAPRSSHDADGDHDDDHDHDHVGHDDGSLPFLPTDAVTMAAAQRLLVTPSALKCPTEIVGIVDVHAYGGEEDQALMELRVRAVLLGAQALTNIEYRHGDHHEKLHLSGTAVRCNDLLRGRPYDLLAKLDIVKPMGHEEEALEELRARARELGANVIVDVRFEHGDASRLRLVGKAVRAHEAERSATNASTPIAVVRRP
jgi:uncharacterized protein YbjQ (UPF0145 family)